METNTLLVICKMAHHQEVPMYEHRHTTKYILCLQCDMLVTLPRLEYGQKVAYPQCGTTLTVAWDAPRQRPAAYTLAALLVLLLSNLFPFVNMNVAEITGEMTLLEIPDVLFSEDYANFGTFFLLSMQLVPALCLITIPLLMNRTELPVRLKEQLARMLFQPKTWRIAEIFLTGVPVSFVKLMTYGNIGVGSSFLPQCLFCVLQLRAFQCVDRRQLQDDITPIPELRQPLKPGVMGMR